MVFDDLGAEGFVFTEVWETSAVPAPIEPVENEPTAHELRLLPPPGGARIRVVEFPPDDDAIGDDARSLARLVFERIGAGDALDADAPHPFMHRTETVDFGIVLEGELVLILDEGETTVREGDIVIQRGTNHAWSNRTGQPCRVAFILLDGEFGSSFAPGANRSGANR